jgi:hypothetical protein
MAMTNKGIFYPTSSDQITPLETILANIASSADKAGVVTGEQLFTGSGTTGGIVTVNVTFPITFTSAPRVTATVKGGTGSSVYAVTISGDPTTTGFSAKVFRCNGSTAETNLKLVWAASTYAV